MHQGGRAQWVGLALLACALVGCRPADSPTSPQPALPVSAASPKPGERVRQPELDGYCGEPQRPAAFYYHGGVPAVRVARKDACAPLYLTECEAEGRCYPPRDQEPGMWCCSSANDDQPTAHATR